MKRKENPLIFAAAQGEMAEWSNAAVLKTVEGHTSGGSNPSFSATINPQRALWVFLFYIVINSLIRNRFLSKIHKATI